MAVWVSLSGTIDMKSDDSMRQDGRSIDRQIWNPVTALSHLVKSDLCIDRRERAFTNKLVRAWLNENPSASEIEKLNFFRVVVLTLQMRAATNHNMTMSGARLEDDTMTPEEFEAIKVQERKLIPGLDKQLADALRATGETKQQKKIDDSIATSAEAASAVFNKYKIADSGL
jgi:hypothetical protein